MNLSFPINVQHEHRIDVIGGYLIERVLSYVAQMEALNAIGTPFTESSLIKVSFGIKGLFWNNNIKKQSFNFVAPVKTRYLNALQSLQK